MWGLGSASFSANEAKNTSTLTEGEGRAASASADFSRSKQAVPVNSSKQRTLVPWVGLGGGRSAPPRWVAEACSFLGSPLRGSGLQG